jgi:hypothetical protein
MSSESLVEGPAGVLGAWENNGQVFFAPVARAAPPLAAPGPAAGRKHPSLVQNAAGETLFAWTEGTGWQRGGALAWQIYDRAGKPTGESGRLENAIPVWGLPTAVTRPDGGFVIIH